jgi:hypothetical protein
MQAEEKDVSSVAVGFIIASNSLTVAVMSPIVGYMVSNNYWFLSINCCMSVCPLAFGSLM